MEGLAKIVNQKVKTPFDGTIQFGATKAKYLRLYPAIEILPPCSGDSCQYGGAVGASKSAGIARLARFPLRGFD
jgi:hypothetical protein